jgi:hypothetical protein
MSIIIKGGASSNLANVNASNQLMVVTEVSASQNPKNVGAIKIFSENDNGTVNGTPYLLSPETDDDYRFRVAHEHLLDNETFNYTAQNTGKHTYSTSTLTATWTTAGLTTNGGSVTTTGTGLTFGSYAEFPLLGASHLYAEFEGGFSALPVTNCIVDFGMFRRGAATAYAPTDGMYFRLTSAGLQGVINYNGAETTTAVFNFTYIINRKYQFIISATERDVEFWIDGILYGDITTPAGNGQPCMSTTLPVSVRHAHTGTTSAVLQFVLNDYTISIGGTNIPKTLGEIGNATFGSYQGLSGGTMGSLTVYTNNTNATAAAPSNTALTANLPSGLGGQAWETFTTGLAANTDGILMSYQVPAGTVSVQGRRLKVTGVKMTAFVQTALTGGGFNSTFALAFGHTAVSLATAEAATAKARRIVLLPELTQTVASGATALTLVSQFQSFSNFDQPIYVNPGEFIAFTVKHIGTVASAGTIAYNIQYVYSWE